MTGPGHPLFPFLPFPGLDWAGPAPVLPISPTLPGFCCTGLRLWERKLLLSISCQGVAAFRRQQISPSSLSLSPRLMGPRTEKSKGCHREDGRNNDKLPIRLLIANLEYGGWSGIIVPSSAGCCPCPPSLWQSFGHLTSLVDCELLKGRDHALCPCVVSFWHRKVSIKV